MTIAFNSLFARLGKIGHLNYVANVHQAALPATFDGLFDLFTSQPDRQWVLPLNNAYDALLLTPIAGLGTGVAAAQQVLFEMVKLDNPGAASSVPAAVQELIRQMIANSEFVETCTVAAANPPFGTPVGNGSFGFTVKRGDGTIRQNVIQENTYTTCEVDSYSGGATAGQEQFRFVGAAQVADRLSYDWPGGSGASFPFLSVKANSEPSQTGNILTNSTFETFTVANTPDNWAIESGTAGTQVLSNATTPYFGTSNVRFVGHATAAAISQTFGDTTGLTGTTLTPYPEVNYSIFYAIRVNTVPAAGVLTIELTDSSNTVITDEAGTTNTFTASLPSFPDGVWVTAAARDWRFPREVIAGAKIRVRLSTALSVGSTVDIQIALTEMVTPYPGGPSVAIFGGSTPWARGDTQELDCTNNRAGESYLATWNAFFDRVFQMRENGLQLPYSGAPTQLDTLITS